MRHETAQYLLLMQLANPAGNLLCDKPQHDIPIPNVHREMGVRGEHQRFDENHFCFEMNTFTSVLGRPVFLLQDIPVFAASPYITIN